MSLFELKKGQIFIVDVKELRKYHLIAEVEGKLIIPMEPDDGRLFFDKKGASVVRKRGGA